MIFLLIFEDRTNSLGLVKLATDSAAYKEVREKVSIFPGSIPSDISIRLGRTSATLSLHRVNLDFCPLEQLEVLQRSITRNISVLADTAPALTQSLPRSISQATTPSRNFF
jgi:hypothetical protein